MTLRPVPDPHPYIACVLAVAQYQDRRAVQRPIPLRRGPPEGCTEPCLSDYGLTARESGAWGRLRAAGLSPKDAADVLKAARK